MDFSFVEISADRRNHHMEMNKRSLLENAFIRSFIY